MSGFAAGSSKELERWKEFIKREPLSFDGGAGARFAAPPDGEAPLRRRTSGHPSSIHETSPSSYLTCAWYLLQEEEEEVVEAR